MTDYEREAERTDRIEALREKLLADRGALAATAREYVKKGYLDERGKNFATSILGQLDRFGKITDRQWCALAGAVAYVDVKDEEGS